MKLSVSVTLDDIKDCEHYAGEFDKCPVAKALERLGCEYIDADEDRILLTHNGKRYVFKTPRPAMLFINDFDNHRHVEPVDFDLEKPKLATVDDERRPLFGLSY